MKIQLLLLMLLLGLIAGCAHNNFGVPNVEWETRRVGLGEQDMPAAPPSAGPDSPWAASTGGAWAAGNNPAGMIRIGPQLGALFAYGSHAQDVSVEDLVAQTDYQTIANSSRAAGIWGGAKRGWAIGSSLSFPFDFTYGFVEGNRKAESSGLIGQLSLGGAISLGDYWSVGAEIYGLKGNQKIYADYDGTFLDEDRSYSGFDYGAGVQHRAEVWQGICLGFGVSACRGATLKRSDTGTMQMPPKVKAGIFGSYDIYRVSGEAGFRNWPDTTTGDPIMDIAYSTFAPELYAGGAVDFLLGERGRVSVGYQRSSIPVRNDQGFRMYDSRYGVGGAFPVDQADVSLGLWFGTRGNLSRDNSTVSNIILSATLSLF